MLRDVEQVGNPADSGIHEKGTSGEKQPGNDSDGLQQVEPVGPEPLHKNPHTLPCNRMWGRRQEGGDLMQGERCRLWREAESRVGCESPAPPLRSLRKREVPGWLLR